MNGWIAAKCNYVAKISDRYSFVSFLFVPPLIRVGVTSSSKEKNKFD